MVRRLAWVRPKPKPAGKLESVKWEDEKQTGYPWKNLKALTREKKVWLKHMSPKKGFYACAHTRPELYQLPMVASLFGL